MTFSNVNIMIGIGGIGLAVITVMLCAHIPHREHFAVKAAVLALALACYILFAPLERMEFFIHLPVTMGSFLFVGLCYRVSFVEVMFLGIAGNTIARIAALLQSILALLDPERFAYYGADTATGFWGYALIAASYVFTYVLAWFLLVRRIQGFSLLKTPPGALWPSAR